MPRSNASTPYRVLLVDDHQIIRDSLDILLAGDPRFQVVGQADNGIDAVRQGQLLQPHLMVVDMDLPGLGGLEVMHQLRGLMERPPRSSCCRCLATPNSRAKRCPKERWAMCTRVPDCARCSTH